MKRRGRESGPYVQSLDAGSHSRGTEMVAGTVVGNEGEGRSETEAQGGQVSCRTHS